MAKTNLKIDKSLVKKMENLLPRLKYSITPFKLIKWLENFEKEDIPLIQDLILAFEYIPFIEMQYRLGEQLDKLLKHIPLTDRILFIPFGDYGKSSFLVTYPLKNTTAFKHASNKRRKTTYRKHFSYSFNFKDETVDKNTHIVFIDDFVGSGDSFITAYNDIYKKWIKNKGISNVYLLSVIIMKQGETNIDKELQKSINVFAERRENVFNGQNPIFKIFKNEYRLKKINYKYGKDIYTSAEEFKPWGYGKSGALIAFDHGTPNNTLPIIWGEKQKVGERTQVWYPLYPRWATKRMQEAKMFKKDISFYLGILNRLQLDRFVNDTYNLDGLKRKYNKKLDFSNIAIMKLKKDMYNDIMTCQLLGITQTELEEIYSTLRKKKYLDLNNVLTALGTLFLNKLETKARQLKFRQDKPENFNMKKNQYIPISFGGIDKS
ncbi:hypothetical protein [Aquimarina spinulae]|uniref:phosphoribosyltransferase-like protein n=1 Tax=Aquimarina spinulae TaxID=1192023 RepID=UPI000D559234|nr:hypothetical protein [Aquimarina spinulae]